jgi:hypothetical protein
MTRLDPALRIWLGTAGLVCAAAACTHDPDVVAELQASSNAGDSASPSGGAGAGAGGANAAAGSTALGGAGKPAAPEMMGTGGTMEVAGTDANDDDAGVAGSTEPSMDMCPAPVLYWPIKTVVDGGCKFKPALLPDVTRFFQDAPTSMPIGESRPIELCDITHFPAYLVEDGKWVLCETPCNTARKWLAEQDCELKRCMGFDCESDDGS